MKRSIYISIVVFIGIMFWTCGELIIFGSSQFNGNESLFVGFVYFFFVVFCTHSVCADIHYKMRPRHASYMNQSMDLHSIVSDDLYIATDERLG